MHCTLLKTQFGSEHLEWWKTNKLCVHVHLFQRKEKHFPVCLCLGVFETLSDPFTYKSISVFGNFYMDSPPPATVFDKEYYFAGVLGWETGPVLKEHGR